MSESSSFDQGSDAELKNLNIAVQHHSNDRLAEAETIYRQILKNNPNQAVALHLLGILAHQVGQSESAIDLVKKSLTINSNYDEAYFNLGNIYKDLQQHHEAIENYTQALKIKPDNHEAHNNLGITLANLRNFDEAIVSFNKALAIKPDYTNAHSNLGLAQKAVGNFEEAITSFKKSLSIEPSDPEVHSNLGITLRDLGKFGEAINSFDKALTIKPDDAVIHSNKGIVLRDLGKLEEAKKSFNKALSINPDYAEGLNNLGLTLTDIGNLDDAIASFSKAMEIKPKYSEALNNLCELYEKHNMVTELERTINDAQITFPDNDPNLLYRLAQLANRENRFDDAQKNLERIKPDELPAMVRPGYSTLLGKTYDKLGMFAKAFRQFETANNVINNPMRVKKINSHRYLENISQLTGSWSSAVKNKQPQSNDLTDKRSLVFLIGFPRSGTTLIDTILRSHPEISVIEEKPMVQLMCDTIGDLATPNLLSNLKDDQLSELDRVYFDELYFHISKEDSKQNLIIDRNPLNIVNVGLIHRVFPKAKFILTLRHPYDCVLSCFMQNFELNDAMVNFLSLDKTAKFYDSVMSLWVHYSNALDLEVEILKYEDLIHNMRGSIEPILNFMDTGWHENLLNYQQTGLSRRKINTASYNQVTQSLYNDSIGRWKNYETQMERVLPLLEPWSVKFGY